MPEKQYDHNQIELKWSERWADGSLFRAEENSTKPKFYVLEMLAYPSDHSVSGVRASSAIQ